MAGRGSITIILSDILTLVWLRSGEAWEIKTAFSNDKSRLQLTDDHHDTHIVVTPGH